MQHLRLTDPLEDLSHVRPSINLFELLHRLPPGTKFTSYVGEAQPGVFGLVQTDTCKFLYIDGVYYFGDADWLQELEVGEHVVVQIRRGRLVVTLAPYPMAHFDLGAFLSAAAGGIDGALRWLGGGKSDPESGILSIEIGSDQLGIGTRIALYEIPDGVVIEPHLHTHGECFYVVEGMITDEHGSYPAGQLVVVGPNTFHTARAQGRTVIIVMWTGGISSPPPP